MSTAIPFTRRVAVSEYVPRQAPAGTRKGNGILRSVFGVNVKDGVLNDTEFVLPQLAGCSGPVNVNLTTTICVALAQALTTKLAVIVLLRGAVDGVGVRVT